jgi:hypothetical protein
MGGTHAVVAIDGDSSGSALDSSVHIVGVGAADISATNFELYTGFLPV